MAVVHFSQESEARMKSVRTSLAVVSAAAAVILACTGPATAADACRDLCKMMPGASARQATCAATTLQSKGYPVADSDTCLDLQSATQCRTCYAQLDVSDQHCSQVRARCFKEAPAVVVEVGKEGVRIGDAVEIDEEGVRVGDVVSIGEEGVSVAGVVEIGEEGVSVGGVRIGGSSAKKSRASTRAASSGSWGDVEGAHPEPPEGLRKSGPILCRGDADMVVQDRYIDTEETAIVARDQCVLQIRNCFIVAGRAGVVARDESDVKIEGSFVQGSQSAVLVQDSADAYASGSTFRGKIRATGVAGDFHDDGTNERQKIPEE